MDAWVWQDEIGAEEGLPENHPPCARLAESIHLYNDGETLPIEYLVRLKLPVLPRPVTIVAIAILAPKPGKKHVEAGNLCPCSGHEVQVRFQKAIAEHLGET